MKSHKQRRPQRARQRAKSPPPAHAMQAVSRQFSYGMLVKAL